MGVMVTPVNHGDVVHAGEEQKLEGGGDCPNDSGATQRARKTEATLSALLESSSEGIVGVDHAGRIVVTNPRVEAMFGYERDELVGQTVEVLLPESLREVHASHRQAYVAHPRSRAMGRGLDLLGRRKDGKHFPVEISLSYVELGGDNIVIALVTDITERKRLEAQILQSQKMEAIGRLAGGLTHDFNNLLTIIVGYNQMMMNRLSPLDPIRGYAEEIMKAAERASALTKQLLAFSRQQVVAPKTIQLNDVVTAMESMIQRLVGEDLELVVSLGHDLGFIRADPNQIEQVLLNLVVNARDAMPDGGVLTIETLNVELDASYVRTHLGVEQGHYVMLAVSDTGRGMDAETKNRIFEPFFTTKAPGKGTGLGLAVVYGIVKQCGGDIWVYSEPERGCSIKIYLPRYDQTGRDRVAAAPGDGALAEGTETLLVVEDDAGVRSLVKRVLEEQGFRVLEATDSDEASALCETFEGAIDLLLTDIVLPKTDGTDVARRLREKRKEMRVLFMSGYTNGTATKQRGLPADADFLQKPFTPRALVSRVRKILDAQ